MEFQFTSDICTMLYLSDDGIPFRMIRSLDIVPYLILDGYNDFKGWEGLHQPTSSPLNSLTPTPQAHGGQVTVLLKMFAIVHKLHERIKYMVIE